MPRFVAVIGRMAVAVLAVGAASAACAQAQQAANEPTVVIVHPARVPVAGSPQALERAANLRPPPDGPIESRFIPLPEGSNLRLPRDGRSGQPAPPAVSAGPSPGTPSLFVNPPVLPLAAAVDRPAPADASGRGLAASSPANEPTASSDRTSAIIPFAGQSASLTDSTRSELDQIAKRIAAQKVRHIELRAFASGNEFDSRKIALARALVVRAYLIDSGVKSRIEIGSFSGEGAHVEILIPKT